MRSPHYTASASTSTPTDAVAVSPPPSTERRRRGGATEHPLRRPAIISTPPNSDSEHDSEHDSEQNLQAHQEGAIPSDQAEPSISEPAQELIQAITELASHGTHPKRLIVSISPADFRAAQHALCDTPAWTYFCDKLRFDWDAEAGIFTFRMPGNFHDTMAEKLRKGIEKALDQWQGHVRLEVREVAARILSYGTSDLFAAPLSSDSESGEDKDAKARTHYKMSKKSPDMYWRYEGQPTFVAEVAVSEDREKAEEKVAFYFNDAESGTINTVVYIFVDLNEPGSTPRQVINATLTRWRFDPKTNTVNVDIDNEAIPISAGGVGSGALQLHLSEFVPLSNLKDSGVDDAEDITFDVPFQDLTDAFRVAAKVELLPRDKLKNRRGPVMVAAKRSRDHDAVSVDEEEEETEWARRRGKKMAALPRSSNTSTAEIVSEGISLRRRSSRNFRALLEP